MLQIKTIFFLNPAKMFLKIFDVPVQGSGICTQKTSYAYFSLGNPELTFLFNKPNAALNKFECMTFLKI